MINELVDAPGVSTPEPFADAAHPMRKVTRQVAFDQRWDGERAAKIAALFDGMAADWAGEVDATKVAPVHDALARSDVPVDGHWLELGSGTGAGTSVLAERVASVTCLDISGEMLAHAPADLAPRVQGDASSLPFADDTFDALLLVNMLLFPSEVDRVLRSDGCLLWVNSLGDQTPIHLPVADVAVALPGEWSATTANAGTGFWATLSRR